MLIDVDLCHSPPKTVVQPILLVQSMTQHRHHAHLYSTRHTQLDSRSKEEEEENEAARIEAEAKAAAKAAKKKKKKKVCYLSIYCCVISTPPRLLNIFSRSSRTHATRPCTHSTVLFSFTPPDTNTEIVRPSHLGWFTCPV